MNQGPIGHTSDDGRTQLLYDHLTGTAKRAAEMAVEFGCGEWGYLVGLWHDLRTWKWSNELWVLLPILSIG